LGRRCPITSGEKIPTPFFFVLGVVPYLSIPYTVLKVSASPAVIWLVYFYAATRIMVTIYGGGFATIPAYLSELFGTKNVGGVHGRLVAAWSMAGILGPLAIARLRESSRINAVGELINRIDPDAFEEKFGTSIGQLDSLVAKNTVTISNLMEILPEGTVNPSSGLYKSTMYLAAGLLGNALVANLLVRPVDPKYYFEE
jgi:hypothetical protein